MSMRIQYTPSGQITSVPASKIYSSVFEFLYANSGSAIYVSNTDRKFIVDRCLLRFCISNDAGGAIKVILKSFEMTSTCFDTCFICRDVDNIFGNTIHASSPSVNDAVMNFTSFFCCGPQISISADSTMYFKNLKLTSSNLNFSKCCSTGGSLSVAVDSAPGYLSYIVVDGGKAWLISCIFGNFTLAFSYSNFIDCYQEYNTNAFWADYGLTTFNYCCIYLSRFFLIGKVEFQKECYGNVGNNILSAPTTLFPQILVRADDYCYNMNGKLECSLGNLRAISLVCLFVLIQLEES